MINLSISVSEKSVFVKVSDTGGGIPTEVIGRIFEKYYSTKNEQGSGIGLYMSKEMIKNSMNGDISVQNILGGAMFTITLPKA